MAWWYGRMRDSCLGKIAKKHILCIMHQMVAIYHISYPTCTRRQVASVGRLRLTCSIKLCHIISYHNIISYHIISYHIISYHILHVHDVRLLQLPGWDWHVALNFVDPTEYHKLQTNQTMCCDLYISIVKTIITAICVAVSIIVIFSEVAESSIPYLNIAILVFCLL